MSAMQAFLVPIRVCAPWRHLPGAAFARTSLPSILTYGPASPGCVTCSAVQTLAAPEVSIALLLPAA